MEERVRMIPLARYEVFRYVARKLQEPARPGRIEDITALRAYPTKILTLRYRQSCQWTPQKCRGKIGEAV